MFKLIGNAVSSKRPKSDSTKAKAGEQFASTHWSVVLAAGDTGAVGADEALESLCRTYWYPLYVYVRRRGYAESDAQDLTQEFFGRLLAKKLLRRADPERGKFRSFLLKSLQHFLVNEWERARTRKRGDGQSQTSLDAHAAELRYRAEPALTQSLDEAYEKRWAATLIEAVLARLRADYAGSGRLDIFEALKPMIWGEQTPLSYPALGTQLRLTAGAVKVAVHRLRARYRELLRAEVALTVSSASEVDDELRHLIAVLSA
jgi:RNA polymerase sigma-70 factor (ECF subfamily)